MTNVKKLDDKELKNVSGGFVGDISNFEVPNVGLYSENMHALFWGCSVRRISDEKNFKCTGYSNNNDGTTSWAFVNDIGTFEQFIFVATEQNNGNILIGYEF